MRQIAMVCVAAVVMAMLGIAQAVPMPTPIALSADGQEVRSPQVTIDGRDRTTVVWARRDDVSRNLRIQALRLDADGTTGTTHTLSADGQQAFAPQVAIDSQHRAVVVWSRTAPGGAHSRIQAVRLAADGTPGTPVDVSMPGQTAFNPQVAIDSQDRATITWSAATTNVSQVRAVRLDADGAPGTPQDLSAAGVNAFNPQIVIDSQDQVTVAWHVEDSVASTQVQAVRFTVDGTAGLVRNISRGELEGRVPQIALDGLDRATITWQGTLALTGPIGIQAVRLSAAGVPADTQTVSQGTEAALSPQVAVDGQGRATITWAQRDAATGTTRAHVRRLDADGLAGPTSVLSAGDRFVEAPQVAVDRQGRATVTWYRKDAGIGGDPHVQAVRVAADGTPGTVQFLSPPGSKGSDPQVVLDSRGQATVVWEEGLLGAGLVQASRLHTASSAGLSCLTATQITSVGVRDEVDVTNGGTADPMIGVTASGVVTDVDVLVDIGHPDPGQLDLRLRSPQGTEVVLSTGNGAGTQGVFKGTTFTDQAVNTQAGGGPVTDAVFVPGKTLLEVQPEGALARLIGEDPNGGWTLVVVDAVAPGRPVVQGFELVITTADALPATTTVSVGSDTAVPITGPGPTILTQVVTGAHSDLADVDLTTVITHDSPGDLDLMLTSPAGTTTTISTDNGAAFAGSFAGTTWDDQATTPVTDAPFADDVVQTTLQPEGAMAAFAGEEPNGTWTLSITDDQGSGGILNSWSLDIAASCDAPPAPPIPPPPPAPPAPPAPGGPPAGGGGGGAAEPPEGGGPDPTPTPDTVETGETVDLTSDDVVQTAIDASQARFPTRQGRASGPAPDQDFTQADGPSAAVLARADVFADALGGSVLLGDAPLLFTTPDTLDPRTAGEIERLDVDTVYLLGGTQALAEDIATTLAGIAVTPIRLAGPSRIETAVAIASQAITLGLTDGSRISLARAFGEGTAAWADSVTGGGYAASIGTPVLLTPTDTLHPAVQSYITDNGTSQTVLLGGTAALADTVETAVPDPTRVAGPNRAATAVQIARTLLGVTPDQAERGYHLIHGTATDGWAYGLIAAGLVADTGQPILLTDTVPPPETLAEAAGCDNTVALTPIGPLPQPALDQLDAADSDPC